MLKTPPLLSPAPTDKKQELRMGASCLMLPSLYHRGYGPVAKLCPPVDVRAIANWSNEQRHSRMCAPDGFHRLDRACIGSQLPKLPSLQSIGLMITGLAPLTADTSYQARCEIAAALTT